MHLGVKHITNNYNRFEQMKKHWMKEQEIKFWQAVLFG